MFVEIEERKKKHSYNVCSFAAITWRNDSQGLSITNDEHKSFRTEKQLVKNRCTASSSCSNPSQIRETCLCGILYGVREALQERENPTHRMCHVIETDSGLTNKRESRTTLQLRRIYIFAQMNKYPTYIYVNIFLFNLLWDLEEMILPNSEIVDSNLYPKNSCTIKTTLTKTKDMHILGCIVSLFVLRIITVYYRSLDARDSRQSLKNRLVRARLLSFSGEANDSRKCYGSFNICICFSSYPLFFSLFLTHSSSSWNQVHRAPLSIQIPSERYALQYFFFPDG